MRDWLVSRQRYWGVPFPIVFDNKGEAYALESHDLPVKLPSISDADLLKKCQPLSLIDDFVNHSHDGVDYKREVDTMDTFMDSSWYFLRFTDPKNHDKPFDVE